MQATDLERARDALRAIPPDMPRDEWVRAGMAAKAAGLSFEDFDAWSAQADIYNAAAARDTWRSIKDGKGIGPGTLFHLAGQHGWQAGAERQPRQQKQQQPRTAAPPSRPGVSAAEVWKRCTAATAGHGYIVAKDGTPDGLRIVPDGDPLRVAGLSVAGALAVPVLPLSGGQPMSLQFIAPPEMAAQWKAAGKPGKLNLPGAPMAGGVFVVGELQAGCLTYVVEGIGQAWACWKATGAAAVVSFGWGNVRRVAAELRRRDAAARLVLVPDAGKEAEAAQAAAELGAEVVAMPDGSPPNFDANDYAKAQGFDALEVLLTSADGKRAAEAPQPWRVVPLDDLDNADLPPQAWHWLHLIPTGEVTSLNAHGGLGKSTIAAMLTAATAAGQPLFGVPTVQAPVVFFSAEDGADTVRRRLRSVLRVMGLSAASLASRITVLDATAGAPELGAPMTDATGRQTFGPTPTGERLRQFLADKPGALLIVDNASDTMGGNENARAEVRAFVRLLASMVRDTGGAVLLLAHVDKGTSRGDRAGSEGYSGSTAWHNSVRSRLYLSRDKDGGALLLEHQKSNLGPLREPLRLVWPSDGLPALDQPLSGTVQRIASDNDTRSLLRLVHEFTTRGEFVSTAASGPACITVALRSAAGYPKRMPAGDVLEALRRAERRGWIERVAYVNAARKARERWQVTLEGCAAAEIAPVAPVAPVVLCSSTVTIGNRPAPVAPVPARGGWGGRGAHKNWRRGPLRDRRSRSLHRLLARRLSHRAADRAPAKARTSPVGGDRVGANQAAQAFARRAGAVPRRPRCSPGGHGPGSGHHRGGAGMTARRPADPFELLCRQAAGRPIPEPPAIPGRCFVQRMSPADRSDPFAEAWDQSRPAAPVAESTTANPRTPQGLQADAAGNPPASPPPIPEPGEVASGLHTSALTT